VLFPEGTRTPDGQLLPAKSGIGLIVAKSSAPVVPVRLVGTTFIGTTVDPNFWTALNSTGSSAGVAQASRIREAGLLVPARGGPPFGP
jgi:1-acyl-sn-glycerol-3-phosphate acyltransferase